MGKSLNDRVNGLMKRGFVFGLFAAAAMAACCGWAEERADFLNGIGTNGWTIGAYEWTSPSYGNAVDLIRLEYVGNGNDVAAVFAVPAEGDEMQIATINGMTSGATFEFPDSTDFRSFRVEANDNGGWRLAAFSAVASAITLDAPDGVSISNNVTGTSFDACWDPVVGATGYRVYVWTNAVAKVAAGADAWSESFANAPSTTSSSVSFKSSYTDSGKLAWTHDKVYAYSETGKIRIGNTTTRGVLVSPPLPEFTLGSPTLRIRAYRQTDEDGESMPIKIVSGDFTNEIATITLTSESADYEITVPALAEGDRIALCSTTDKTKCRVIIDEVSILSDYYTHAEVLSLVDEINVGAATSCSLTGLPSVPVQFAVEAYGRRGVSSAKTPAVEVDLSNPDKVAQLNACPLSSLDGNVYTQDFDSLAPLTETTGDKEWLNGTTLQYWQGYKNDEPITKFTYNGGAENSAGLYALASDRNDSVRALGAYSTQGNKFSFGIAFTNGTDKAMCLANLTYSAQQWGFANTANQTLSVSALVTNRLDWISACGDGWTELGSTQSAVYGEGDAHDTPVTKSIAINPDLEISVAPGQVLMIKWTIHSLKSGKPGMMGIDNVTVEFAPVSVPKGFSIHIAGNSAIP